MRAHAAERYGIPGDRATGTVAALKAMVLAGVARFRRPLPGGRSEWEAYLRGRHRRVRFVWDETSKYVVTVLPARRRRREVEVG